MILPGFPGAFEEKPAPRKAGAIMNRMIDGARAANKPPKNAPVGQIIVVRRRARCLNT
jgi:hypothetical protein